MNALHCYVVRILPVLLIYGLVQVVILSLVVNFLSFNSCMPITTLGLDLS